MTVDMKTRRMIVRLDKQHMTHGSIAKAAQISRRTVINILDEYKLTGDLTPKPILGRPRKLNQTEERYAVITTMRSRRKSAQRTANEIKKTTGKVVSAESVRRVLHRAGLHGRRVAMKPRLTSADRKERMNFVERWGEKDENFWMNVIFSDEAAIEIHPKKSGRFVWRTAGERFSPATTNQVVPHGGGHLLIWACLTGHGIGFMCRLPKGLDAETYIEILNDELVKTRDLYYSKRENVFFQHDGSGVHRADGVLEAIPREKFKILKFPPYSPDLTPIENFWADLKRRVIAREEEIHNIGDLWEVLQEEYENTPIELCKNLIQSMPHRLAAVKKSHGWCTKY